MLRKLSNHRIFKNSKIAGVEISFLSDGGLMFRYVLLSLKGDNIAVDSIGEDIDNWEDLLKAIPVGYSVAVVLTGKGVLHKKGLVSSSDDDMKKISKVIPNAKSEDFYIQVIPSSNSHSYVSIVRKELVDEVVANFSNSKFYPVSLSLGIFDVNSILPFFEIEHGQINICNYSLDINEGLIEEYRIEQDSEIEKVKIGDELLPQASVIAFSAGFNALLTGESVVMADSIMKLKEENKHKNIFKTMGWALLIVFFVSLLLNFLLFDYYNKQSNLLEGRYNQNKGMLDYITEMKTKVADREKFIDNSGLGRISKTSYYADRIALSLPDNITLLGININPLEKKIKEGESILFKQRLILVKGKCSRSSILYDWIIKLKKYSWISSVSVLDYLQEEAGEPGVFEIEIKY